MNVANLMKAGLAAVALVSSTAMPAAAHGEIRYIEIFYLGGVWHGEIWRYCDGDEKIVGIPAGDYSEKFYGPDGPPGCQ